MNLAEKLIISRPLYISDSDDPKCGYCKGQKDTDNKFATEGWRDLHKDDLDTIKFQSTTVGFHTELITAEMYDKLCNLGYRRSGNFIYKTDMLRNCCRLYTIRTNKAYLKMSKELKMCLRRFKKNITSAKFKPKPHYSDWVEELCDYQSNSSTFKTVFEPALFSEEKFQLYVKYQESIHHDEGNTTDQFESFLCNSPFSEEEIMGTTEEWEQLNNWFNLTSDDVILRNGPVHECYYHNGKLIAVAVLDFFSSGISSVYFIWDPDYSKWSLGKVSALREIAILSKINRPYYYLGYYIEDCPKMNYKAKYGGEILDVCNNKYIPLSKVSPMLKNGELFVGTNQPTGALRQEIDTLSTEKVNFEENFHNAADEIYGPNGVAFETSNQSAQLLKRYGLNYDVTKTRDIYIHNDNNDKTDPHSRSRIHRFPNFVPGLVPLTEILEYFENGTIGEVNRNTMIFDTRFHSIRVLKDLELENSDTKTAICDVIRLIGLNNTKNAIVII